MQAITLTAAQDPDGNAIWLLPGDRGPFDQQVGLNPETGEVTTFLEKDLFDTELTDVTAQVKVKQLPQAAYRRLAS